MSNQDGATSLVCEYINQNGEKDLAVIWSGLQDEPGVTYLPIPDDQNREILQAWFASFEATVVTGLEYNFAIDDNDPDHVVAKVEFVEPKTPCQ